MDEKFELACFQIITYVGTARTHFINAIHCAKEGKYDEAAELIKQGDEAFSLGHNAHADLLTMDANGEISNGYMLLMHAEDQLMSAESFRILADEFIALYTGICPLYGATQIPWTCPPIISGFLLAGWKSALLQVVILCVSFFVYLPFIKKIDKMNLVQEKNQPVEDEDEDW